MEAIAVQQEWARQEYRVDGMPEPISHFTDAVAFGPFVFLSGCGPVDSEGKLVGGDDILAQTRQVHENLKQVLQATGCSFSSILKVIVYLSDMSEIGLVNQIRQEYFGDARPASTLVEVSDLATPGMRVEIEAIAVRES